MGMVKQLSGCVRQYKKDAVLTPLFVIGEVILEVMVPLIMAKMCIRDRYKGIVNYFNEV